MDANDPFAANIPAPTAARPLLGLTVLVVEDSRYTCEALRLLCLRSGARIRRADCLRSARRHFRVYRPSMVIIDMGLPDGNGADLIAELNESQPRVQAILAISGNPTLESDAMAAGADGFMEKPIISVGTFQEKVLALMPAERRPKGPRQVDETQISPDKLAFQDDMAHIADVMEDPLTEHTLDYIAQFLRGVARSADDHTLEKAAKALETKRALGQSTGSETAQIAGLIQLRLSEKIAI